MLIPPLIVLSTQQPKLAYIFSGRGYLASAKSYIPGMGQVTDAASGGAGKAQQGLGAAGYASFLAPSSPLNPMLCSALRFPSTQADLLFFSSHSSATKDVTSPIPVVGSVVEGVGNAPIAQKIGGKEEEKGYLGSVYEYAGGALRTVYDAAGNVVCMHPFIHPIPHVYLCSHLNVKPANSASRNDRSAP